MSMSKKSIGYLISRYSAVLKKCRVFNLIGVFALGGLLCFGSTASVCAEDIRIISIGNATLALIVYAKGERDHNEHASDFTLSKGTVDAVVRGIQWWSGAVDAAGTKGTIAVVDLIAGQSMGVNATATTRVVSNSLPPYDNNGRSSLAAAVFGGEVISDWQAFLTVQQDSAKDVWYLGAMHLLPSNCAKPDLASTFVHELAHAWGFSSSVRDNTFGTPLAKIDCGLRDINGNAARAGMPVCTDITETSAEKFVVNGNGLFSGVYYQAADGSNHSKRDLGCLQ